MRYLNRKFRKYRKAVGAGLGSFLASFPLVAWVGGENIGDAEQLGKQAIAAAIVAAVTAAFPANEEETPA